MYFTKIHVVEPPLPVAGTWRPDAMTHREVSDSLSQIPAVPDMEHSVTRATNKK